MKERGPNPNHPNSPEFWNGIPFNFEKKVWGWWKRSQLPDEYKEITDWFSDIGLEQEAKIAGYFHIPWSLRGPPTGPIEGRKLWMGHDLAAKFPRVDAAWWRAPGRAQQEEPEEMVVGE